jgi:serine/threonine protein phosphatase PrpC/CRP-like cAMP-binding protein
MHPPESESAQPSLTVAFSARTDVGRVRAANEDNFLIDRRLRLHIVCDGLGGHRGGEVASATAVNVVREELLRQRELLEGFERGDSQVSESVIHALLRDAVTEANHRIHERGRMTPSQRGMGTTLSLLVVVRDRVLIAHVGDTRVYRMRGKSLTQLTRDHSLESELEQGLLISPAQLEGLEGQYRNQVTRAVGVFPTVDVDLLTFEARPGDRFLLCSDGLHGLVDDLTLSHLLDDQDVSNIAERMVDLANVRGGRDNITALVLELGAPTPVLKTSPTLTHWLPVLRACPLLRELAEPDLTLILPELEERHLMTGESLVHHAEPLSLPGLCIVATGELEVFRHGESVAILRTHDYFGEDTLLAERPRDASIIANTATTVLLLNRSIFEQLQQREPGAALRLALSIARCLGRRLETMSRELGPRLLFEPAGAMTRPMPRPQTNPRALVDTEPDASPRAALEDATNQLSRKPRTGERRIGGIQTRPAMPNSGRHTRPLPRPAGEIGVDLSDIRPEPPPLPAKLRKED